MKVWKSSFWRSNYFSTNTLKLNFCSAVLLRDLKPGCSSSEICSAWLPAYCWESPKTWTSGSIRRSHRTFRALIWSSMLWDLGWYVVDTRWLTILRHPYCFLQFFFKYWCFWRFVTFSRPRSTLTSDFAETKRAKTSHGVLPYVWLLTFVRRCHSSSVTKWAARISRERFVRKSPNFTRHRCRPIA